MRDLSLPHQVVIQLVPGSRIAVSCLCLATSARGAGAFHCTPIEVRSSWQPGEAIAAWRAHMAEVAAA